MCLAPLCSVLLIIIMRACPPRCTRVVRGLLAVPGNPRQELLPASRPAWAGAQGQQEIRLPCAPLPQLALTHYFVVMRPILLAFSSTNQTLPSGPAVMPSGLLLAVGIPNVEKLPLGVMRPMALPSNSVNQRLPSEPAVMPSGPQPTENTQIAIRWNSVMTPAGVMRPIWFPSSSVNQRLPSGPAAMPRGKLLFVLMRNSVMAPAVVLRPILPTASVNQSAPSGPAVMPTGPLLAVGVENSVMAPAVVLRPILPADSSVNHRLPSGPAVIPSGILLAVGTGNTVNLPLGVMRPISPAPCVIFVNQRLPSGP